MTATNTLTITPTINGGVASNAGAAASAISLPTIGKMTDVAAVAAGNTALVATAGITTLTLTNAAAIATYTLTAPAAPVNGQIFVITSPAAGAGTNGVTLLTLAGAAFSIASPFALPAGRSLILQYNAATASYLVFLA